MSYSDPEKALHRLWIDEWAAGNIQGTPALLLLDPTKSAYEAWCIPSSAVAAWGPSNFWYYAKAILRCRTRRIAVRGEAGQLGADFVLAPGGAVLLKHYCRNPTDRVSVSTIIDALGVYRKDK